MTAASAFVDIIRCVTELLRESPAVATRVDRNRLRILPQEVATAAVVRLTRSLPRPGEIFGGTTDWQTAFAVECYARADSEEDADLAVDPLMREVYARVSADPALGGVAMNVEIGPIEWDFAATGENLVCATLNFVARHQTAAQNLESPPS